MQNQNTLLKVNTLDITKLEKESAMLITEKGGNGLTHCK